jgi:hypothetical protein
MYGDRRQPWHPSARRTYTRVADSPKVFGVGRVNAGERLIPPLYTRAALRVGQATTSQLVSTAASVIPGGSAVAQMVQDIPGISSLFSSADGGPNDKRVVLLAQAYQQAVAGLNVATPYPGTGLPYLQNWLADQPPHPEYSNQIAQQLITAVQTKNPAAAAQAVPVSVGPAINPATGQPVASTYAGVPGVGLSISPVLLIGGAVVLVLLLRK